MKLPIRAPGTRQDVAMAVFDQYNRMFEVREFSRRLISRDRV